MTRCRQLEEQLSLYVDDLLDANEAAEVRAHLDACPACTGLAADLSRIASTARLLGPIAPPPHVYERIAAGLPGAASPTSRRPTPWRPLQRWVAVAAALVVVASLAWLAGSRNGAPAPAAESTAPITGLAAVASELNLAVQHYERAIAELEAVSSAAGHDLDPDLARSIRASLGALDRAIAESRAALDSDPASEPARASLFEALRLKVDVLQSTVVISNEPGGYQPAGADGLVSMERGL